MYKYVIMYVKYLFTIVISKLISNNFIMIINLQALYIYLAVFRFYVVVGCVYYVKDCSFVFRFVDFLMNSSCKKCALKCIKQLFEHV